MAGFCIARVAKVSQRTQNLLYSLRSWQFLAFLALLPSLLFFVSQSPQRFRIGRKIPCIPCAPCGSWRSLRYFLPFRRVDIFFCIAKPAKVSQRPQNLLYSLRSWQFLAFLALPPSLLFFVSQSPQRFRKARKIFCIPCAPCGSWRSLRYFPRCYFLYRKARKGFAKPAKSSVFLALLALPGVPCVTSLTFGAWPDKY